MSARQYLQSAREALDKLIDTQLPQIQSAARLLADTVIRGGSIFSFGASHSFIITEELVYRTGGLMLVNPIYPHGMNLSVRPLTLTSQLERVVGLGRELLANSPAKTGDALILASTSGRNAVAIDMALLAREKGIQTIAITSLATSDAVNSRHPSGKKLAELADVVIDNAAPYGDAAVEIPGCRQKVGPLSSVTGCAIANALVTETVQLLVQRGMTPPVFMSANLDGGDAFNAEQLRLHRDRIHYL
jgi:uncharacterized phosphosugar-binding protein